MSRESAMAVLQPTVSEPQFPPEVWGDASDAEGDRG